MESDKLGSNAHKINGKKVLFAHNELQYQYKNYWYI